MKVGDRFEIDGYTFIYCGSGPPEKLVARPKPGPKPGPRKSPYERYIKIAVHRKEIGLYDTAGKAAYAIAKEFSSDEIEFCAMRSWLRRNLKAYFHRNGDS